MNAVEVYLNKLWELFRPGSNIQDAAIAVSAYPDPIVDLQSKAFSLSTTGTIISAVTGERIIVYAIKLVCTAALTVNLRDGAGPNLEGGQAYPANGGYCEIVNPPWSLLKTSVGNSLDLVISGTGTAAGRVSYWTA